MATKVEIGCCFRLSYYIDERTCTVTVHAVLRSNRLLGHVEVASSRELRAPAGNKRKAADAMAARDEKLKWFRAARFGMFIHWGVYSVIKRGTWIRHRERIPADEYTRCA